MSSIEFEVNVDANAIQEQVTNLLDDVTMTRVHKALAKIMYDYVPMQTGALADSGVQNADAEGVHYTTEYAEKEYYATHVHRTDIHPLASSEWDKAAMATHYDEFAEIVKQILIERARELYG